MEGLNVTQNVPSDEEKRWVQMLADGKSYRRIAKELETNANTFAYRITALRERYNCDNSTALVAYFFRNNLIE